MGVQSILFNKKQYSLYDAIEYLHRHRRSFLKIDETKNYYRFRQTTPRKGMLYFIKTVSPGVLYVIEF